MTNKILLVLLLTLGLASPALAMGSSSAPPQNNAYKDALKAIKAGNYARATTLLESVVQKEPRNADAWNNLGYSERQQNHFDKSLVAYRKALAIKPGHRGANEYLGELYLKTGDLPQAREQLKVLRKLCPRGCEEADELAQAVQAYEVAHPGS